MDNVCRVCLQEYDVLTPIFQNIDETECLSLAEKISSIAQVQIEEDDGLPQSICFSCNLQIEKLYDFQLLVKISDRTLRSSLKDVNGSDLDENSDEKIDKKNIELVKNEDFDLEAVNAFIVPTEESVQVWKLCETNKEESEEVDSTYQDDIFNNFEPYNEDASQVEFESELDTSEITLNETSKSKTKVQRFQKCIRCDQLFRDSKELADHLYDHADEIENKPDTEIKCQVCYEPFPSLKDLKNHIQVHFFGFKKRGKPYQPDDAKYFCSRCNREFLTADQCSKHVRRHSELKIHKCDVCNKVFSRNGSKKRHELSHIEKKYECQQCGKIFKKRPELRYHLTCHVEIPPKCELCHKNFQNSQSLKLHMKRHSGDTTFTCKTCGKVYFSNGELNRHIQIHLGKRDFPCPLCDQSFFSKPELNRHSKYHRGEKKFKCHICSKSYFESGHLKVHIRAHTGERPFICNICNKGFVSKSKLMRHQKIHFKSKIKKISENTEAADNSV